MKKVYINPAVEIVEFQLEDFITASAGGVTTNAVESNFTAADDGVGIGTEKVVEFDFSSL